MTQEFDFVTIESDEITYIEVFQGLYDNGATPGNGGGITSVFGRTGPAITAQTGDYNAAQVGAQPENGLLSAIAGATANGILERTGATSITSVPVSAFAKTLIDDGDAATARATLGLGSAAVEDVSAFIQPSAIGVSVQGYSAALNAIDGLTPEDGRVVGWVSGTLSNVSLPSGGSSAWGDLIGVPSNISELENLTFVNDRYLGIDGAGALSLFSVPVIPSDTDDIAEANSLYYTEARVTANTSVAANTTHRGLVNNPHAVNAAQVGADPSGTAAAAIAAHESAANPHTVYALASSLGSAAFTPASDYATDAQGALASTALQPAAIGATVQGFFALLNAIGNLTSNGFIERTGASTAQTIAVSNFIKTLLDDANASAARTTLELGTASTRDTGTATGDVPLLQDVAGTPGLPAIDGSQLTGLSTGVNFAAAAHFGFISGAITIETQINVASITRLSTGVYQVSFSTPVALPYVVVGHSIFADSTNNGGRSFNAVFRDANGFRILSTFEPGPGGFEDAQIIDFLVVKP